MEGNERQRGREGKRLRVEGGIEVKESERS